jgi:serine/threonine protein kinase
MADEQRETTLISGSAFQVSARYKLLKQIGSGAYGVVASAQDLTTGQRVAIKKIGNAFADLVDAKRVLREIKIMRTLGSHENIVELVDLDVSASGEDIYEQPTTPRVPWAKRAWGAVASLEEAGRKRRERDRERG